MSSEEVKLHHKVDQGEEAAPGISEMAAGNIKQDSGEMEDDTWKNDFRVLEELSASLDSNHEQMAQLQGGGGSMDSHEIREIVRSNSQVRSEEETQHQLQHMEVVVQNGNEHGETEAQASQKQQQPISISVNLGANPHNDLIESHKRKGTHHRIPSELTFDFTAALLSMNEEKVKEMLLQGSTDLEDTNEAALGRNGNGIIDCSLLEQEV